MPVSKNMQIIQSELSNRNYAWQVCRALDFSTCQSSVNRAERSVSSESEILKSLEGGVFFSLSKTTNTRAEV